MNQDENKDVAPVEEVLNTTYADEILDLTDGSDEPVESTADDEETPVDTVGETADETVIDETPDGEVETESEESSEEVAPVETGNGEVTEEEVANLQKQLDLITKKVEILKQIREQTAMLLEQGEVLKNTDEEMPEVDEIDAINDELEEIPAIEETQYIETPIKGNDEE